MRADGWGGWLCLVCDGEFAVSGALLQVVRCGSCGREFGYRKRSSQAGGVAIHQGMPVSNGPWVALGLSRRTYFRRKKGGLV